MPIGKLKLSNLDIENNKDMLNIIYEFNDNLEIEFSLNLYEITQLFKYYVNRNIEYIDDIDEYDCIDPEFKFINDRLVFTLNSSKDEEDQSDILFLEKEFKKHFGVNISKCSGELLLNILFFYSSGYYIEDDIIYLNMYYENYEKTWLGDYFKNYF